MRRERLASVLLLVRLIVWSCSGTSRSMLMAPNPPGEGNPPVITASFAADKGAYGDPIRVYLAAEHQSGVMEMIAVQVSQTGGGVYPTSWSYLKPEYGKKFVGYLQWNTYSPEILPERTNISMNITIIDTSGYQSKPLLLPYQFVRGVNPSHVLPAPFDQGEMQRIGWINIELVNPTRRRLLESSGL